MAPGEPGEFPKGSLLPQPARPMSPARMPNCRRVRYAVMIVTFLVMWLGSAVPVFEMGRREQLPKQRETEFEGDG